VHMHVHVGAQSRHAESLRTDLSAPVRVSCLWIRLPKHIERPRTFSKIPVVDRRGVRLEIAS
jgi:hypothetical protein